MRHAEAAGIAGSAQTAGVAIRARALLKRARHTQPFNAVATTSVRAVSRLSGRRWAWAVKHLHRVGGVTSRLPNGRVLRLWSRADDWVSNQVFWLGWRGYEPETTPLFFQLARSARGTIDVGAHVGFFTLLAAHANPSARVVAFEPLPALFARLQANVARNGLANVSCVRCAVGDTSGEADFYHCDAGLPCSSSLSLEFMRETPGLASSRVRVTTIDDHAAASGLGPIDLVKIDTESTEPDVLRGMVGVLERFRPTIICEVLPGRGTEGPLEALLRPLGYSFYHLRPSGPCLVEHIEGHPELLNYAFVASPAVFERAAAL